MHPSYLSRFGVGDPAWLDPTLAASIFVIALIVSFLLGKLLFPLIIRFTQWTPTDLDTRMVQAVRLPITFGVGVLGAYLAFTVPVDLSGGQQEAVNTIAGALGVLLGVFGVASLVTTSFDWYVQNVAPRTRTTFDDQLFPLFRRIAIGLVYGLGALLFLDQLHINISPLIAGLGLGGLAVALALQPTLANLFAGTYVMTEGVFTPGDYIELENGIAGYVLDVGWRSVRIRTWGNNLVVIPNSKFAETIITNYQRPVPAMNVILNCGVSYDSDLYHVERVSREVMEAVLDSHPDGVKEYGSYFGYESFGDSNVDFWLFLQAKDRLGGFRLKTALMEHLHQRFKEEGIVINYPVRTLQFPEGWGPEMVDGRKVDRGPSAPPTVNYDRGAGVEGEEGPEPG